MCLLCHENPNDYYHTVDESGLQILTPNVGGAELPVYTADQVANFLTHGFWGGSSHSHSATLNANGSLKVDITALNATGQAAAQWALQTWTATTGITFTYVNSGADITFDDENAGAQASPSFVNVNKDWNSWDQDEDSYYYQTYVHEIGHALGLGHSGNYNGSADYATDGSEDNHYLNDSWQMTVMSYFDTRENTTVDSWSWGTYLATPMLADIIAIQNLYGNLGGRQMGDTIWGEGSNVGGYLGTYLTADRGFIIADDGGVDTIDFSSETADQTVDLTAESKSSVGGVSGNMFIMRDTIIENFFSGSGDDDITGNGAKNWIKAGAGEDVIKGGGNDDGLNGNGKSDIIFGGTGDDILRGGGGKDVLYGGDDNDVLRGGIGRDKLFGGDGEDTFVFKDGWAVDLVKDFEDDVDTIELHAGLWGGGAMTVADLLDESNGYASVVANNGGPGFHVELDFGGGDVLKIHGVSDLALLDNDITLIF